MNHSKELYDFVKESNKIEGILRDSTSEELITAESFLDLEELRLHDLLYFVGVFQPEAILRDQKGLNVYVGNYVPPAGDISIKLRLEDLLRDINTQRISPYVAHISYEMLHPFTDCNGRSGRMLWYWMMRRHGNTVPLGFLHTFYYQTLSIRGKV